MQSDKPIIIALPYAGGSKHAYRAMQQCMSPDYTWHTLELPGRGDRYAEACLDNVPDMVADLLRQARPHIGHRPYLVFGHSLGALLAHELVRRIRQEALPLPSGLLLTGRAGPDATSARRGMSRLSSEQFWAMLDQLGGLPAELMASPELQAFYEPVMRADIEAIDAYCYQPTDPLPVPILVRAGDREGIDRAGLTRWQRVTSYPLNAGFMPGNHFFIIPCAGPLVQQLHRFFQTQRHLCTTSELAYSGY